MKKQLQIIGSIFGIAAVVLVGTGSLQTSAQTTYTAVADTISVSKNSSIGTNVFLNDIGSYNEYTLSILYQPTHGSAQINTEYGSPLIEYFPETNYLGQDSLTYQACQTGKVHCDTAELLITVIEGYQGEIDGAPDADVNNDGIVDYSQANLSVTDSFSGDVANSYLLLNQGCIIKEAKTQVLGFDSGFPTFINDSNFVSRSYFKSTGCTQTDVILSVKPNKVVNIANLRAVKYGISPDGTVKWFDFTDKVTFKKGAFGKNTSKDNIVATYSLTDGKLGDDTLNGEVNDPIIFHTASSTNTLVRTGGIF
jgi:hypothetical protein